MPNINENTKERMFEISMVVIGLIGLLILFTILFRGPEIIIGKLLDYFNI